MKKLESFDSSFFVLNLHAFSVKEVLNKSLFKFYSQKKMSVRELFYPQNQSKSINIKRIQILDTILISCFYTTKLFYKKFKQALNDLKVSLRIKNLKKP